MYVCGVSSCCFVLWSFRRFAIPGPSFKTSLKSSERFVALELKSNRPGRRGCNAQKVRDENNVTFFFVRAILRPGQNSYDT